MEERLKELNFDAIEFAVKVATGEMLFPTLVSLGKDEGQELQQLPASPEVRTKVALSLLPYMHATKKAVELSNAAGEDFVVRIERD